MTAATDLSRLSARDLRPLYGQLGFVYTGYLHANPESMNGQRIRVRRGYCSFWVTARTVRYIGISRHDISLTDINGRTTIATGRYSADSYAICLGFGSHAEMYQAMVEAHWERLNGHPSPVFHGLLISY